MPTIITKTGDYFEVDDKDYCMLMQHNWRTHYKGYAYTSIANKTILMHRLIMQSAIKIAELMGIRILIDHIDGNPKNNRRTNLRPATQTQNFANARNPKKYMNIVHKNGKYVVSLSYNHNTYYGGTFYNEADAIKARNELRLGLYGPYNNIYKQGNR